MSETFFTSDHHFGHFNIIRYCNRPFKSLYEMNTTMIERWNARVQPEDIVYHLGDFAMGPKERWLDFFNALLGHKILVIGSHDKSAKYQRENMPWEAVYEDFDWNDGTHGTWHLVHKPLYRYDRQILSGHVHQHWTRRGSNINVGVDVRNFEPKTIEELLAVPSDIDWSWEDVYSNPKH